jgi:hypothetical protein
LISVCFILIRVNVGAVGSKKSDNNLVRFYPDHLPVFHAYNGITRLFMLQDSFFNCLLYRLVNLRTLGNYLPISFFTALAMITPFNAFSIAGTFFRRPVLPLVMPLGLLLFENFICVWDCLFIFQV